MLSCRYPGHHPIRCHLQGCSVLLPPEMYEGKRAMTKTNHVLGKLNLIFGGAGGQVEQVAAKPSRPSLPVPNPSVNEVLEDQAAVEAPLLED